MVLDGERGSREHRAVGNIGDSSPDNNLDNKVYRDKAEHAAEGDTEVVPNNDEVQQ